MDPATRDRVRTAQTRINEALREPIGETGGRSFSDYMPGGSVAVQDELLRAASAGGLAGIEAIFDAFDRLRGSTDPARLRHALSVVLTHHPALAELGLRLPSLEERSPWKTWPSKRE
jgi:hypothetical protein